MNKPVCASLLKATAFAAVLASGQALAADGFGLAQKNGCFVCHQPTTKRIGPSFQDIAKKYAGNKEAAARIANFIAKGTGPDGQGWKAQDKATLPHMPANTAVTPENAAVLAQWVLTEADKATDKKKFASARISVGGLVKQPLELNLPDLKKLPNVQMKMTPNGSHSKEKPVPVLIRGVLLRDILEKAVVAPPSPYDVKKAAIIVTATDGYKIIFSWPELFYSPIGEGVVLYFEKNEKPLDDDEGKIALTSLGDNGNFRYMRWVRSIDVRTFED